MLLQSETIKQQETLVAYCRDGQTRPIEGITENRIHHYRRLVFNVIKDALASTYPLTVNLLNSKEWKKLCQEFFSEHTCLHPQVWRMPEELIEYIEIHQPQLQKRYPHLLNLLQLEWLEAEFYMMPDRVFESTNTVDFLKDSWNLNPESSVVHFEFPVHLKNARYISPSDIGNYYCLVFRHPESFKVKFINLSPFLAWLISTMKADTSIAIDELLPVMQKEFGISDTQGIHGQLSNFFQNLVEDGMAR